MSQSKTWSLGVKLLVTNAVYVLPCAVLAYFLVAEKDGQIQFGSSERDGLQYLRPLQGLVLGLYDHKELGERRRAGENGVAPRLESVKGQIERDLRGLRDVDERLGASLQFTEQGLESRGRGAAKAQRIATAWTELDAKVAELSAEGAGDRYEALLGSVRKAVAHAGDTSNLILDPDLDSYYMMDAVLLGIPQLQERLQRVADFARAKAKRRDAAPADALEGQVLARLLQADVDRIVTSFDTALNEDRNFYGRLESLQTNVPTAATELKTVVAGVIEALRDGSAAVLLDRSATALAKSAGVWGAAATELDRLIDARLGVMGTKKTQALLLAILAWLPSALVSLVVSRSLRTSFTASVDRLRREAESAIGSSARLATTAQTVSANTTEQAAAIHETGASISQMASMVARTSGQARDSQTVATRVADKSADGCRVIERMVDAMGAIEHSAEDLQTIHGIIQQIAVKTRVINDIVLKTQLLSFNASIEAARAGQQGRGFAVVAEEVGSLARSSGQAAKDISELIGTSQSQVSDIVNQIIGRVADGRQVSEQARTIFGEITTDITTITAQVEAVCDAAQEQQMGIDQIAKAMVQMDQTTQASSGVAQVAATLSDQLRDTSGKLSGIARDFDRIVRGENEASSRNVRARATHLRASRYDGQADPETPRATSKSDGESAEMLIDQLASRSGDLRASGGDGLSADDPSFKKVG